jgi:hypothetical protein
MQLVHSPAVQRRQLREFTTQRGGFAVAPDESHPVVLAKPQFGHFIAGFAERSAA